MSKRFCNQSSSLEVWHEQIAKNERRTLWVVILTSLMMIVEVFAGYWTGSMALLADGYHMASHAGALGLTYLVYHLAKSDFIGELLAPADLFGSNGLPISDSELAKENGRAGKRGLDSIPTRTEAENPEILTQRLRELCSTCEAPIVLEFKNYENTGGSDEES